MMIAWKTASRRLRVNLLGVLVKIGFRDMLQIIRVLLLFKGNLKKKELSCHLQRYVRSLLQAAVGQQNAAVR